MFGPPIDTWYLWLGVGAASVAVFGVALALPTAAPPDATAVAATVDSVASSDHEAVASRRLRVEQLRLGSHAVALRTDGGVAHASFAYAPVTPTGNATRLASVLHGTPPESAFDSPSAFAQTLERARNATRTWRNAPRRLFVRRVSWEGVDATLVGP